MSSHKELLEKVLEDYPGLSYDSETNLVTGRLDVDGDDHFFIELNPLPWVKHRFPTVKEVGGRIPWVMDRHIYEKSGHCCLTTRFMEEILLRTKIHTLADFFREILVPYFLRQSLYEVNGGHYDDELKHGTPGVIQSYAEVLGTEDLDKLIPLLEARVAGKKIGRNDLCFCGAKKLKRCHEGEYELFRLVPKEVVREDLQFMINYSKLPAQLRA